MKILKKFTELILWHSLTDLALQTHFIAKWKDPLLVSAARQHSWFEVMLAHALINGWGVLVCTSYVRLAILETFIHFTTDYYSAMGVIPHSLDQFCHITGKLFIACIWYQLEKDRLLKIETEKYWGKDRD